MMQGRIAEGDQCGEQASPVLRPAMQREAALYRLYRAERRAGANSLEATERMNDYAKQLDATESQSQTTGNAATPVEGSSAA